MSSVGGRPCGRMCTVAQAFIREQGLAPTQNLEHCLMQNNHHKLGSDPNFYEHKLGSDPNFYGDLMFSVGGRPCGRMCTLAPAFIREQGLAPTQNLEHCFLQNNHYANRRQTPF